MPFIAQRRAAVLLVLSAMLCGNSAGLLAQQAPATLSAREADDAAVSGRLVLIDIRSPDEWRETGIPASAHAITMHQDQQSFLSELAAATGGSKSAPIALICAVGNRSANLQAWMRQAGYTNVSDVSEGMIGGRRGPGWLRTGLPTRPWRPGGSAPVASKPNP